MIALSLLFLAALAAAVCFFIYGREQLLVRRMTLKADLKRGSVSADVSFFDLPNFQHQAERLLCRFASTKDRIEPDELESHFRRQIPQFNVSVIRISNELPKPVPEPPKKISQTERDLINLTERVTRAAALMEAKDKLVAPLPDVPIRGRSLKLRFIDYVEGTVGDLLDHPDKV